MHLYIDRFHWRSWSGEEGTPKKKRLRLDGGLGSVIGNTLENSFYGWPTPLSFFRRPKWRRDPTDDDDDNETMMIMFILHTSNHICRFSLWTRLQNYLPLSECFHFPFLLSSFTEPFETDRTEQNRNGWSVRREKKRGLFCIYTFREYFSLGRREHGWTDGRTDGGTDGRMGRTVRQELAWTVGRSVGRGISLFVCYRLLQFFASRNERPSGDLGWRSDAEVTSLKAG